MELPRQQVEHLPYADANVGLSGNIPATSAVAPTDPVTVSSPAQNPSGVVQPRPQHRLLTTVNETNLPTLPAIPLPALPALPLTLNEERLRIETIRRLIAFDDLDMFLAQLEASETASSQPVITGQCMIHFEETTLSPTSCCKFNVCHECNVTYVRLHVTEGNVKIHCINAECTDVMSREEIRERLTDSLKLKFDQFLVDANRDPHCKTCPRCSQITRDVDLDISPRSRQEVKHVKKYGLSVTCVECKLLWCFTCHAPSHAGITCEEYGRGDKLVKRWAKEKRDNQVNAHRCPKCKVLIQRSTGCDHMQCTQCATDFCYRCGEKRKVPKPFQILLGTHDGRFGAMSCKYSYLPNAPVRRRLSRGAILCAKLAALPIVLGVAAAALPIAVIALPVGFGIVKLRQALRARRVARETAARHGALYAVSDLDLDAEHLDILHHLNLATTTVAAGLASGRVAEDNGARPLRELEVVRMLLENQVYMAEVDGAERTRVTELMNQLEVLEELIARRSTSEMRRRRADTRGITDVGSNVAADNATDIDTSMAEMDMAAQRFDDRESDDVAAWLTAVP